MITKNDFMLCNSITKEELKNLNGNWKGNLKLDGERIIAIKQGEDIFLINRRGREKSLIYPEIVEDLKQVPSNFIIDGELITKNGIFNSLQHRVNLTDKAKIQRARTELPITFMIFDIINFNGKDLRLMPLKDRLNYLNNFNFEGLSNVGFVAYEEINKCLEYAEKNNCEGIVLKNMDSYYEHRRSNNWLKLKFFIEDEIRAIRYTENPKGIRVEDKDLNAIQIAGQQHLAVKKEIDEKGFCDIYIQYLEKTEDNRLRFPSYRGIKND